MPSSATAASLGFPAAIQSVALRVSPVEISSGLVNAQIKSANAHSGFAHIAEYHQHAANRAPPMSQKKAIKKSVDGSR
jgi:hypothetical protein